MTEIVCESKERQLCVEIDGAPLPTEMYPAVACLLHQRLAGKKSMPLDLTTCLVTKPATSNRAPCEPRT
ncbi:hypothetical protein DPMN_097694 [Dreissena polymorpha]|uniref:Uncharacterized protein n=1 Tax=Dreissena polymorpha TaxID=45954 RepID=A0A9D4R5M2_DREPO|nr:hypothetical protein DPMN_097694 [Dreissena polymorpha]